MRIDLNCDVGELEGSANLDAELMRLISSANIACGAHAGNPALMRRTIALALEHGVAIGAHPGYEDRAHFGRRPLNLPADTLRDSLLSQLDSLAEAVAQQGGQLRHIKPHGALYNQAGADAELAARLAQWFKAFDPALILVGGAGGALLQAGRAIGLNVASEGFADRRYRDDGQLLSRQQPGAVLNDPDEALKQARALITGQPISSDTQQPVRLAIDTLCLHGDSPQALNFAQIIHHWLQQNGVQLAPLVPSQRPPRPIH
ncbi:LamB/YcsF family protein [Halomonas denitrificans]|nr:LamB/YcsF family protein [Halomonas denitrificans]